MSPEPLANAAVRKRADALARARAALSTLDARGDLVTFQSVAREAGVSRQWLYKQPELRQTIEDVRATQAGQGARGAPPGERSSEASLRQRVEHLLEENRRLRQEGGDLRAELALAYGSQREAPPPPTG